MNGNNNIVQKAALYGTESEINKNLNNLIQLYHISYICPSNGPARSGKSSSGIAYITAERLKKKKNLAVIIVADYQAADMAYRVFSNTRLKIIHYYNALCAEHTISSSDLASTHCFYYRDQYNNTITIKGKRIPKHFQVFIQGSNNHLTIGENVYFGDIYTNNTLFRLHGMGNKVFIGDGTTIGEATFTLLGGGCVYIGKDCLISRGVTFHPVDGHHMFNMSTGRRTNYPGTIVVEDHVWICQDAALLGNAHIGRGSILAFRALTSSTFGPNRLVAGFPAKELRTNVGWARDTSAFRNYDFLEECDDQNGFIT